MTLSIAPSHFLSCVRQEALSAPESGIVEVFNHGRNKPGLIPLWVGEGDLPTPSFICEAATRALAAGETFYTYQRGIPELRETIARYMAGVYGTPFSGGRGEFLPERFFVTVGGMHAVQMAVRIVAGNGEDVLVPTPAWPNFTGALKVAGANPVDVPMTFDEKGWQLDPVRLEQAITPKTRAIIINSPANPTGWTATHDELSALLALARKHGLWIIADEIYGRFVYSGTRAPSFHDVMEPDDRIMFVQTLSKNWAMTGWRIGWLEAPPALGQVIENLMQYSTSGVAVPTQRAAIAAITHGEAFLAHQLGRSGQSRDILCKGLRALNRVHFTVPEGAFYLFCRIEGEDDTRRLALRLVDEANLGIAPGTAFGAGAEPFIRICFARKPEDMAEVVHRLTQWLGK